MFFAIILSLLTAGRALALPSITIATPEELPAELSEVDYLIDIDQKLTLEDIERVEPSRWAVAPNATFNMPVASVWLRFELTSAVKIGTILEHRWNLPLDGATLYRNDGTGWTAIKAIRQFAPMFAIEITPGRTQYLMHLQNCKANTMKTRLRISDVLAPHADQYSGRDLLVFLYGITVALVFMNIGWFILYRRAYFLYYVTYNLSMLGIFGITSFHLPNFMQWLWDGLLIGNAISIFLFMSSVLSLKRFAPKVFYTMALLLASMAGLMMIEVATGQTAPWYVPHIGLYLMSIAGALLRQRQGYRPAIFFVAGWTVLTAGFLINAKAYAGHVGFLWRYALYLAFAVESVLFAIAVGFKARMSEVKATAENTHAFRQMAKVFYPHQIMQIRDGRELEQTMPVGAGEACVICFDIVGSSKINHEKAKDFFRNVFRRCNEAMDDGYHPQQLAASGYRIKEMGDGFICSVGYPFKTPTGSMANDAFQLAQKFAGIFAEEVEKFGYHEPLYCCIGLAMDSISGFYPAGGTRSYDLFGRSIILANRYEAMRKVIASDGSNANLLILQERVYYSLDSHLRSGIVKYVLRDHGTVVRDDPAAERLYYLEIKNDTIVKPDAWSRSA